jgi:anti-sigma-K factor RskA
MSRLLRSLWRLAKAAALVAALVAGLVWVSKRRAREQPVVEPPVWPPLPAEVAAEPVETAAESVEVTVAPVKVETPTAAGQEPVVWLVPKEGACPEGYPVKAKLASRIYHVPGGTSYPRTTPDRCYASPADAEADGFRPAKR